MDEWSGILNNVTVLGGLTLNSGSLLLSGTTTIENTNGTGPGTITLNGLHAYFSGRITELSAILSVNGILYRKSAWQQRGRAAATIGTGGLVQGYGQFFEGQVAGTIPSQ